MMSGGNTEFLLFGTQCMILLGVFPLAAFLTLPWQRPGSRRWYQFNMAYHVPQLRRSWGKSQACQNRQNLAQCISLILKFKGLVQVFLFLSNQHVQLILVEQDFATGQDKPAYLLVWQILELAQCQRRRL